MAHGVYFQLARGRAIVRKNAMKTARRYKARLERRDFRDVPGPISSEEYRVAWLRAEIAHHVRRAREANRAWRSYRKSHLEIERLAR